VERQNRHRIINVDFNQRIAGQQTVVAMESAENEGWPLPPNSAEALPSNADAGIIQRAATQVMHHFHDEYRFWSGQPAIERTA
jgi:hypothetical protein